MPLNSLDWAIGLRSVPTPHQELPLARFPLTPRLSVKVTTLLDDTITGQIYAYDPLSSVLTLITSPDPKPGQPVDLRFLKTSFLKDVVDVSPKKSGGVLQGKGFANQEWSIGRVDVAAVGRRERDAAGQEAERERRIGKGVTKEGQDIFDALSRT